MTEGYKRKEVLFYFVVSGQAYELEPYDEGIGCSVEETQKNGQEDTHFGGYFWRDEDAGKFVCEEETREHGEDYGHDIKGITAHLDQYGIPGKESGQDYIAIGTRRPTTFELSGEVRVSNNGLGIMGEAIRQCAETVLEKTGEPLIMNDLLATLQEAVIFYDPCLLGEEGP